MTAAEKLTAIAENQQKVYEAGREAARKLAERTITEFSDESVETIGAYAFRNCQKLETVNLPAVTEIDQYAFGGCNALKSVYMPLLESMVGYEFSGCSALAEIELPKASSVSGYAFNLCTGLKQAVFDAAEEIGNGAFYKCSALQNVSAPNANGIGQSAFLLCSSLTEAVFPKCYHIDAQAFAKAESITKIDIGRNLTASGGTISNYAFNACASLSALVLRCEQAYALIGANAFTGTPIADGTGYIYVPQSLVSEYQSATNWSTYADQIRAIEDYTDIVGE